MEETEKTVNQSNYQETPEQFTHISYSETPEQSNSESYVEVPAATVSSSASEVSPVQNDEPSRENHNIDGDVTVQNNVSIGGTLRAKRIVHPWGCLFHTLDSLKTEFPKPYPGMWAIVGSTFPFDVYRCRITGEWELVMPYSLSIQIENYLTENKYATQEWVLGEIGKIKIPKSLTIGDVSNYLIENKYLKEGDITIGAGGGDATKEWIQKNYLPRVEFDDLFEKVALSSGSYAIRAKYALYSNQWISCLGPNPDAGVIPAGATTLGALNNVTELADSIAAADKVLVLRAGATGWSLANLSDIVGLDTTALATYLTNNHYAKISDIPSLADYLKKTEASQLYQPIGDYALSSALTSAINTLNTAIGAKLDAATFDDLFVKEPDGKGGYRIQAKYALYTNSWMSCLGANPDAGTVALGATTLGGLNNVVAAADEVSAAAKVLVREAGASSWTLKSLSDIVGLDTTALATYLTNNHYAKTSDIPSLAGYATQDWVKAQKYLTEHQPLTDYLKKAEAASLYQPIGDYATNSALNSAVSSLNTAIGKKLDAATFDDLFVKESDGNGGYRIKAKYALYSNQYLSCLGNNPDAGTVALGATTLGGLNNVVAAADEATAAAKVLVREAGSAQWTLKNLSDIVGLDTAALNTYLVNNGYAKTSDIPSLTGYATQQWVQLQGYLTEHQSLDDYATKVWVQAQGYLTAITKAQVEAVLTGDITSHTHSQYLTSALAAQTYQPKGDYALTSALNSAVSTLNTAISKKLDAATFDDLFVKESDGNGGYRIRAKYAFYSNQYISCLGNNPGAGTSPGGGVDLDAVQEYLTQEGYATQAWVQQQGYVTALGTSGNYLTWSKNGTVNNITVPFASKTRHLEEAYGLARGSYDSLVELPKDLPAGVSVRFKNGTGSASTFQWATVLSVSAFLGATNTGAGYRTQFLFGNSANQTDGSFWVRSGGDSTWGSWQKVLTAGNYTSVLNGTYVTLGTPQEIAGQKTFTYYTRIEKALMFKDGAATTGIYLVPGASGELAFYTHSNYSYSGRVGQISYAGALTMNSFVKAGGTASQFLKADGSVDSNTYLTSHQPLNYINVQDTRDAATNTSADRRLTAHFKANGSIGLSDGGLYAGLLHFQPWTDASGGSAYELGFTVNGNLWLRSGAIGSAWGAWRKILDSSNYSSVLDSRYVNVSGDTMTGALCFGDSNFGIYRSGSVLAIKAVDGNDKLVITADTVRRSTMTPTVYLGASDIRWANVYANTINVSSTALVANLNADLLDGLHLDSVRGYRVNHPAINGALSVGNVPFNAFGMQHGMPMYNDPEFASGNNNVVVYNNAANGNVVITRIADSQSSANSSGYILQIKVTGAATPALGGFYQTIQSRANAVFMQIFRAKIPVGYNVNANANSMGTNASDVWITSQAGTGKWEWYARMVYCGASGTFSTSGFVSLSGATPTASAPLYWYLSHCQTWDLTKNNYGAFRAKFADALSTARTLWGNSFNGEANVGGGLTFDLLTGTNARNLLYQKMADNDFFRIRCGGTASNAGWVELATADDGTEPIYVRQYTGEFTTVTRTATLLDGSGNTAFPGRVNASYFTANATTLCTNLNADMVDGYQATSLYRVLGTNLDIGSFADSNSYSGFIYINDSVSGWSSSIHPFSYGGIFNMSNGASNVQIGFRSDFAEPYIRQRWWSGGGGNWSAWKRLAFTSSNVASATKLQTARTIWGRSFDGTGNVNGVFRELVDGSLGGGVAHSILNYSTAPYGLLTRIYGDGSVSLQAQRESNNGECFNLILQPLGGRVAIGKTSAAYALDVNGEILTNGWIRTSGAVGWYNQTYGGGWHMDNASWIKSWNKPVYIAYTAGEGANSFGVGLRCYHASHTSVEVQGGSYTMGLGCHSNGSWYWWRGTSSGKGYVMQYDGTTWIFTGVIKTSTGMYSDGYMSCLGQNTGSDMRLKHIIGDVTLTLDMIADAPAKLFRWRYGEFAGRLAVGSIAQYWQQWLAPVVSKRPDDYLQMDYGVTALTASICLARITRGIKSEVDVLKEKIIAQENTIAAQNNIIAGLQSKINELERRLVA